MWCYPQYATVTCTLQNNLTVDVNVTGQLDMNMNTAYHSYAMPIFSLVTAQTIRHSIVSTVAPVWYISCLINIVN